METDNFKGLETKTTPKDKKGKRRKSYKSTRWIFDIHGAKMEDLEALKTFFETDEVTLACVSWESGRHNIHPHWQGYFEVTQQGRYREKMQKILGHKGFHLEGAFASQEANVRYVYGVRKHYEPGWVRYVKNIIIPADYRPEKHLRYTECTLRPFQKEIVDLIRTYPDDRSLHWYWESKGKVGKSFLTKYLHFFHGAIATGGSPADMKHAIVRWKQIAEVDPPIIIVDLARSDLMTQESAKTLEQIKNGLFFSGKYESQMNASYEFPHVIIFANHPPSAEQQEWFSDDRLQITEIHWSEHS